MGPKLLVGPRFLLGVIALATTLGLQPAAVAQTSYKIGVVDLQKAASTSPQAEAARKKIDGEFSKRDKKLIAMQKQIRREEEKLVKGRDVMSSDQFSKAQSKVRKLRREFQRALDEFNEDRNLRNAEELRKLQAEVIKVTQQLAKDEKFDLVVVHGVVVFANERKLDITKKVIERLKRNFRRN